MKVSKVVIATNNKDEIIGKTFLADNFFCNVMSKLPEKINKS